MYKGQLLNSSLQRVIAEMGHTDALTICDAGLPIPSSTERIDLALCRDIPSFIQTLQSITGTLFVEKVLLAEEVVEQSPAVYEAITTHLTSLEQTQHNEIDIELVSHEAFKKRTHTSKAIVRTGECSPYANIILYSGVVF